MKLRDIINPSGVQEIQNKFSEANNLAAIIADKEGFAITRPSNFSDLCMMIRSTDEGLRRCFESDQKIGRKSALSKKVCIHYCHAGLIDLAAPIIVDGVHYGSVLCGQVLLSEPKAQKNKQVLRTANELKLNPDKALRAFKRIKVVDKRRVKASAELLHIISSYIVQMSLNKINQRKLLVEINRKIELEKALKTLELQRLQSQINPHFLINTLNIVVNQALLEYAPKTVEVVNSFSKLLRYNLTKIDKMVDLSEEIESIRNYLFIQKTRFGNHIQSSIRISNDLLDTKIPFMTLHPIVENAIIHGLEPKVEGGKVLIKGSRDDNYLIFEVRDSGLGIDKIKLNDILSMKHVSGKSDITGIGLANVIQRLNLYYGSKYSFDIKSRAGSGTVVKIQLPLS